MRSLSGLRLRVERLADQVRVSDEPVPDPKDSMACVLWAVRRFGLEALVAEANELESAPTEGA